MSETARFIVVFKDSATPEEIEQYENDVSNNGGSVDRRFDSLLKGFSATLTPSQLTSLQGSSIIDYIEPDGMVTTQ